VKSKLSQIIFTFITGASLSHVGEPLPEEIKTSHEMLMEEQPSGTLQKLSAAQSKDILEVKLKGYNAYVVTIKNPTRRSYSISTSSFDAPVIGFQEGKDILEMKAHPLIGIGFQIGSFAYSPIGYVGTLFNYAMKKKAKIFEGKLRAMMLDKDVITSYSQLSRIILVKDDRDLKNVKLELIDMQTSSEKKIEIS